jgi:hypothetical protein
VQLQIQAAQIVEDLPGQLGAGACQVSCVNVVLG